jgi:hypothetical protein
LREFGDVDQALTSLYERAIAQAASRTEVSEWEIRDWFERSLITEAGTRGLVYRGREETGGLPNRAVDLLEERFLLRAEFRAGARWYELVNDRFIEPIQRSNADWRNERGLMLERARSAESEQARQSTSLRRARLYITIIAGLSLVTIASIAVAIWALTR